MNDPLELPGYPYVLNRPPFQPAGDQDAQLQHAAMARDMVVMLPGRYIETLMRLSTDWIGRHGWAVQLLPADALAEDFANIAEALTGHGHVTLLGTAISSEVPAQFGAVAMPATELALKEFFAAATGLDSIVFPPGRQVAILGCLGDFFVLAGRPDFVTDAIGDVAAAQRMFDAEIRAENPRMAAALTDEVRYYAPFALVRSAL